jgi:transposase
MWDWIGDAANPYVVFEYTHDRTNVWPLAWLEGYKGYLQADAGSSYDAVYRPGTIIEVGCWAHARRKFFGAKDTDSLRSAQMLGMVRLLYKVEDEADEADEAIAAMKATPQGVTREQADEVRLRLRQRDSVPVLKKIKAWLDEQAKLVLPRSPMAEAIGYALNQWGALCIYAEHGFLDIDNNVSERALKLIALGRKNWLFVHNDKFGKAYATLYSLIAGAQRHGLDPEAYLRGVLAQVVTTPTSERSQFLPDVWKSRLEAEDAPGNVPGKVPGEVPGKLPSSPSSPGP